MQPLAKDILSEIKKRFGKYEKQALEILNEYLIKVDYPNNDRVIRCVIFLSKNTLSGLKYYLKAASEDPRDVMWWAEYEKPVTATANSKRLRNFEKSFEENFMDHDL